MQRKIEFEHFTNAKNKVTRVRPKNFYHQGHFIPRGAMAAELKLNRVKPSLRKDLHHTYGSKATAAADRRVNQLRASMRMGKLGAKMKHAQMRREGRA